MSESVDKALNDDQPHNGSFADADKVEDILRQTARIGFTELALWHAKGAIVHVDDSLDLIKIATEFSADSRDSIAKLVREGLVKKIDDETAKHWVNEKILVWAVVITPWILVQQNRPEIANFGLDDKVS